MKILRLSDCQRKKYPVVTEGGQLPGVDREFLFPFLLPRPPSRRVKRVLLSILPPARSIYIPRAKTHPEIHTAESGEGRDDAGTQRKEAPDVRNGAPCSLIFPRRFAPEVPKNG